ncbi:MAG: redoxin family protein [Pyrinomonadaceae bacterium]
MRFITGKNWSTGLAVAAGLIGALTGQTWAQTAVPMAQATSATPGKTSKANFTRNEKSRFYRTKNKQAQAKYAEGQAALEQHQYQSAADAFKSAIELDPDYFAAHEAYIKAAVINAMAKENRYGGKYALPGEGSQQGGTVAVKSLGMPQGGGPATEELRAVYEAWAAHYPKNAAIQWGLGKVLTGTDKQTNEQAAQYYQRALALDEKFAPAYRGLAWLAIVNNQPEARRNYLRHAAELDPNDPDALLEYARSIEDSDPAAARKLMNDILKRFPHDQAAYSVLFNFSSQAKTPEEKIGYLERLWQSFPDHQNVNFNYTMRDLFALYATNNQPDKALKLTKAMTQLFPLDKDWKTMLGVQEKIVQARSLLTVKKYAEAATLLAKLKVPRWIDATAYYLLRAEAMGAGEATKSYESLLQAAVPEPNDALNAALQQYAQKLGKTPQQVADEVWHLRAAQSVPFKEFELVDYATGKPVKLADYRGKVVLVNFWFPGCGPCLAEFPYVQEALTKYGPQGFVVLAINIHPQEDDRVLPILTERKYGFVPLKMPVEKWAQQNYGVTGTPDNFLIDAEGRLLFKPHIFDRTTQRTFMTEVEMLLARRRQRDCRERTAII